MKQWHEGMMDEALLWLTPGLVMTTTSIDFHQWPLLFLAFYTFPKKSFNMFNGCGYSLSNRVRWKRNLESAILCLGLYTLVWLYMQSIWQDKCCTNVTPQSAAKTTCIILDRYMYGPVSQFLLRVQGCPFRELSVSVPALILFTDPLRMCCNFYWYLPIIK